MELIRMRRGGIGFDEVVALAHEAADGATVQGYTLSARAARWVSLQGQALVPRVDRRTLFEARLFDGQREWRWLRDGAQGRAALVGEGIQPLADWELLEPGDSVSHKDHRLLLWGTALADGAGGWSKLASPRTGPVPVPASIEARRGAVLVLREYLAVLDVHGNVGLWEERLIGLEQAETIGEAG